MPSTVTHQIFASQLLEKMNWSQINLDAYYLGAQGGDMLYFYHPLKRIRKFNLGLILHKEKIYEYFSELLNYQTNHGNDITLSYIYGYLTHYALDITLHPFIYYEEFKYRTITKSKIRRKDHIHYLIEADLDAYLLKSIFNSNKKSFNYDKIINKDGDYLIELYYLFKNVFSKIYNTDISIKPFTKSVHSFIKYYKLLTNRSHLKRKIVMAFEKISFSRHRLSYLFSKEEENETHFNLKHDEWHYLVQPSLKKNDSLLDLYMKSFAVAEEVILRFQESLNHRTNLPFFEFSRHFHNGVSVGGGQKT